MTNKLPSPLLLDARHVSVDYRAASGTVHAVSDVSFELRRGEILGLAGESGCGKSTLAYTIARLLERPAEIVGGEILYYPSDKEKQEHASKAIISSLPRRERRVAQTNGNFSNSFDILKLSPAQLRAFRWSELSIVFQSAMNALNPVLTIGTQITDVIQTHHPEISSGQRKRRAVELLDMVGISADRLRSYPHELSGGMRQRVIIAIALALNPELIIMDEPTTALDVVVQRDILQLISRLCKEFSTALIFITHDLSLLLELADKVAIMYAGKMVEKATSLELLQHPRHPYSYGLLHSFPRLHGPITRMGGIPGSPPDLRAIPPGCSFNPRCPFAFSSCHTVEPSLAASTPETPEQLVACHLYATDQRPPTASDFAEKYIAKAVEGQETTPVAEGKPAQ